MAFLIDKFTDALFIFIGVFFAFHFDQYQEDKILEKELKFNLAEIMKVLPKEEPLYLIQPFKVKTKKNGEGCYFNAEMNFNTLNSGKDYLRVIKERGLVRFIKNKDIIAILTLYYNEIIPDLTEKKKVFYQAYDSSIADLRKKDKLQSLCQSKKEKEELENGVASRYWDAKQQDGVAQHLGFYIRSELEKAGYVANEKKNYMFSYRFELADEENELKMIEDRKKKRIFEKISNGEVQPTESADKEKTPQNQKK